MDNTKTAEETDKALEFLQEYAKCGIWHNYMVNEEGREIKLKTMSDSISHLKKRIEEIEYVINQPTTEQDFMAWKENNEPEYSSIMNAMEKVRGIAHNKGFNEAIEEVRLRMIARGCDPNDYNGAIFFDEISKLKK